MVRRRALYSDRGGAMLLCAMAAIAGAASSLPALARADPQKTPSEGDAGAPPSPAPEEEPKEETVDLSTEADLVRSLGPMPEVKAPATRPTVRPDRFELRGFTRLTSGVGLHA